MPATPSRPVKPQAPIFQRNPGLVAKFDQIDAQAKRPKLSLTHFAEQEDRNKAPIRPLCIFAAGRTAFDVLVHPEISAIGALAVKEVLFLELPLEANGWVYDRVRLNRSGSASEWPVWHLERA